MVLTSADLVDTAMLGMRRIHDKGKREVAAGHGDGHVGDVGREDLTKALNVFFPAAPKGILHAHWEDPQ